MQSRLPIWAAFFMNTSVNIHGATRDTRVLAGGFVVNICNLHVLAGATCKKFVELHLFGGWLHMKPAVFLVYIRDILV